MESTKFKPFTTKDKQRKFSRNLDSLARIDAIIKDEVQKTLKESEDRAPAVQV